MVLAAKYSGAPLEHGSRPMPVQPLSRLPPEGAPFSVLYASEDLATAVYETVIRDRFDLDPERGLESGDYSATLP